jgi:arginyl-tRNA synthetase
LLRGQIKQLIESAVKALVDSRELDGAVLEIAIEVTDTKTPEHGDYACPFALSATKRAGMPPRAVAEALRTQLLKAGDDSPFSNIEIAGPGFLNLRVKPGTITAYLAPVLKLGDRLSHASLPAYTAHRRIHIEYVSVNPNGPITVGSGRGAAFGDTLSRVLAASGDTVEREYYINDGVNSEQMRLFAESVKAHALSLTLPENGYKGEYVKDVAEQVQKLHPEALSKPDAGWWQEVSQELMVERQRSDLATFGVHFDRWFSEQSMHDSGKVAEALAGLVNSGAADSECFSNEIVREGKTERLEKKPEECGPVWLRSTRWGDDKDRVLTRSDGRPAYIAADVAYLESKLGDRGYDKAYLILGPDHHGYIPRMYAACQALGYPLSRFEIVIFQIVRFVKDGKPAPMRKRDGNIYELRDLIDELGANIAPNADKEEQQRIGTDVSRFFYLMRSHDTHMDFDIDLATKQSDENPVFYAQYAHARICSVLAKAKTELGIDSEGQIQFDPSQLTDPRELTLIKKILDLPHEVRRCATDFGVHRLTTYAVELARTYHHFYDACRVIQADQPELSTARAAVCQAARFALKSTFDLLGVSAPERMDRTTE